MFWENLVDKFIIEGGVKLKGEVVVSGSKNAALPIMAASLLADSPVTLDNIPKLRDIHTMTKMLEHLGAEVDRHDHTARIQPTLTTHEAPYELVKTMRASIYVMGPLLAKRGHVRCALPGGCVIGQRPINLHLKGFEALGARVTVSHGFVEATAKKLKGAEIHMDVVSVGATANVMMGAVLAEGATVIRPAAKEPHIVDLGRFLNAMGARVEGLGTDCLTIQGVRKLKGVEYSIISDYIEAGTLMAAGAITQGRITIVNAPHLDIEHVVGKLREAGVPIVMKSGKIQEGVPKRLKSVDVTTAPHPGFPTDMQAQWMALMSVAEGTSMITETIWENRFMHASELGRMGAEIGIEGHVAVVKGVTQLTGAPVMVSDLRAGAALVLAGLAARGRTEVHRVYHLDRGYEGLEVKLAMLGARIKRV